MDADHYYKLNLVLVDVAMGRKQADLVIRNGRWISVQSGEIIPHTDIAIILGRFAYVGPDASHTIGKDTLVIEAADRFLSPGFLDGHMHVESGMLTVTEFVRAVLPHGTTGMFIDPHEIANIFGLNGVRLMVDEALFQPIHVWVQVPSCVPSSPGFETPGANLGPAEVVEALGWDGIIGLGEMMNFPEIARNNPRLHEEIAYTKAANKAVGGHYASLDLGHNFHAYVASGVEDDHEGTRAEDTIARLRQGMYVMLRLGSAWHDVKEGIRAIKENGLDTRRIILCTDDSHCGTLVNEGHVNRAVKQAIEFGIDPVQAIQMVTLNTSEHFGLSHQIGMIAPGRFADLLILSDLERMRIDTVIAKGQLAVQDNHLLITRKKYEYPEWVKKSVKIKDAVGIDFFILKSPDPTASRAVANVIGVIENQAPTQHLQMEVHIENGEVKLDLDQDVALVALIDRHSGSMRKQIGLVHGFGFDTRCAVASTVAHDCHHLIVVGTNPLDMALAVNTLAGMGGGQIVVRQGEVIGKIALPIAGLMSPEPAELVARQTDTVLKGFRECGCRLNNPNMQLSLLALVVIPELRISDLGLVDSEHFQFIPLLEDFIHS